MTTCTCTDPKTHRIQIYAKLRIAHIMLWCCWSYNARKWKLFDEFEFRETLMKVLKLNWMFTIMQISLWRVHFVQLNAGWRKWTYFCITVWLLVQMIAYFLYMNSNRCITPNLSGCLKITWPVDARVFSRPPCSWRGKALGTRSSKSQPRPRRRHLGWPNQGILGTIEALNSPANQKTVFTTPCRSFACFPRSLVMLFYSNDNLVPRARVALIQRNGQRTLVSLVLTGNEIWSSRDARKYPN